MAADLDVYRDWLGITDANRPLNHYQLLRLKKFEDDASKIRSNYRKMNSHVRKYAAGEFAATSQDLLNELAKSMLTLTDVRRKAEYDASLGRTDRAGGRRGLEEILISRQVLDSSQLAKARSYSNTVGVEMHDAVVQQKLAKPDVVMQAYAESIGLPYMDLSDITMNEELVSKVPAVLARLHSCVPVMVDDGQLIMASPNPITPDVEDELRLRLGMPVRGVLCTPASLNELIGKHYPKEAAQAQMAASRGGAINPVGSTQAATQKAATTPTPSASPLDKATLKKRRLFAALIAFNFIFMGLMFYLRFIVMPATPLLRSLLLAIAAGAVAAGIGYVIAMVRE